MLHAMQVNTKRLDKKKKDSECFEELQALFTCMTRSGANFDSECAAQRRALAECADMAVGICMAASYIVPRIFAVCCAAVPLELGSTCSYACDRRRSGDEPRSLQSTFICSGSHVH